MATLSHRLKQKDGNRSILLKRLLLSVSLALVVLAAFAGCGKTPPAADPLAEVAARVVAQPTSQAVVAETERTLDSLAITSPGQIKPAVRSICRALVDGGRRAAAVAVVGMVYGYDFATTPGIGDRLLTATLLPGTKAPVIEGLAQARQASGYTILLFHERACRSCGAIVWELKQRYGELQKAGVRVVSISTDTDEKKWTEYVASLPWPDKLCDYRGFYSPNMERFGVAATPALFLIDKAGFVTDQYGTLSDILDVLPNEWKNTANQQTGMRED